MRLTTLTRLSSFAWLGRGTGRDPDGRKAAAILVASAAVIAVTLSLLSWQARQAASLPSQGDRVAALQAASTAQGPLPSTENTETTADPESALLLRLGTPVRVRVDELRIDAPVIPVGLVEGNVLQIPKDIQRVGWYEYGPRPGSPAGSSVLVAHRDGTTQGRGVFFALDALGVGARVEVVTSTGLTLPYRVVAVEGIQKPRFQADIEEFFAQDGPPRLTLITCGGAYEPGQGGYQANVIVTAVPIAQGSSDGG